MQPTTLPLHALTSSPLLGPLSATLVQAAHAYGYQNPFWLPVGYSSAAVMVDHKQSLSTTKKKSRGLLLDPFVVSPTNARRILSCAPPKGIEQKYAFVNVQDLTLPHNVDVRSIWLASRCNSQPHQPQHDVRGGEEAHRAASHAAVRHHLRSRPSWGAWFKNVLGGGFPELACHKFTEATTRRGLVSQCWVEQSELDVLGWTARPQAEPVVVTFPRRGACRTAPGEVVAQLSEPNVATATDVVTRTYFNAQDIADVIPFDQFFLRDRRILNISSCVSKLPAPPVGADDDNTTKNNAHGGEPVSPQQYFPIVPTLLWQIHLQCFLGVDIFDRSARVGGTLFEWNQHHHHQHRVQSAASMPCVDGGAAPASSSSSSVVSLKHYALPFIPATHALSRGLASHDASGRSAGAPPEYFVLSQTEVKL